MCVIPCRRKTALFDTYEYSNSSQRKLVTEEATKADWRGRVITSKYILNPDEV